MEPNVEIYCKKENKKNCSCLWLILAVVAVALAFFVGVLVAGMTEIIATIGIGAIITLIIALIILSIISIINIICCGKRNRKKDCY